MVRCKWCNLKNDIYVEYHDNEWGILNLDEQYLFEMLILESFQAGLSWECILNKRENFKKAYDNFDIDKVILYNDDKINELMLNKGIIRNKNKIIYSIKNHSRFYSGVKLYHILMISASFNNLLIYLQARLSAQILRSRYLHRR
jgi:DNA-3-methyladenine glycosylase I